MSAATRTGTQELINAIATELDTAKKKAKEEELRAEEDVRFTEQVTEE